MTTPLSPVAQVIWDAYEQADCDPYKVDPRRAGLAAAFRTLEDQLAQDRPDVMPPELERAVLTERIRLFRRITALADAIEKAQLRPPYSPYGFGTSVKEQKPLPRRIQ